MSTANLLQQKKREKKNHQHLKYIFLNVQTKGTFPIFDKQSLSYGYGQLFWHVERFLWTLDKRTASV